MKKTPQSTFDRKKWWADSLGDDLVDSRTILPRSAHEEVRHLSEQLNERVPYLMGKLVVSSLRNIRQGKDSSFSTPVPPKPAYLPPKDKATDLYISIMHSRFPGETGATRMKQIAMLQAIHACVETGRKPTTSLIAKMTDNHPSQMITLAKALEARGVLSRVPMSSISPGKAGKLLQIQPNALQAINDAHLRETGMPITDPVAL